MSAIDRLCTIATDVSLEATTLAADVRDELANMRSAIGKALADMKDVDEPCDGGSWCFVHDDHVPGDSERCHTGQAHDLLRSLIHLAPVAPLTVEQTPAPGGRTAVSPGVGGVHLVAVDYCRDEPTRWQAICSCGCSSPRCEFSGARQWSTQHIAVTRNVQASGPAVPDGGRPSGASIINNESEQQ